MNLICMQSQVSVRIKEDPLASPLGGWLKTKQTEGEALC